MRGKGLPPLAPHPHPRVWPPTSASLRIVYLDEVEQFTENQKASVASLRRCSPSARNGVRLPSGMLFSLAGIPTLTYALTVIAASFAVVLPICRRSLY